MLTVKEVSFCFMTAGLYSLFFVKTCLNLMISSLLGFIVASGVVLDTTLMRKGYLFASLCIILALSIDNNIRRNSKTFDMVSTIFEPVNLGRGMMKVVSYSKSGNFVSVFSLFLLELVKISCGVYCIVAITLEEINNVFVIYCLLGALLIESLLGTFLYFVFLVCLLVVDNFYVSLLKAMSKWYLSDSVNVEVTQEGKCVFLEMTQLS